MTKSTMSEILEEAEKAPTVEEKVNILRNNRNQPFVDVLQGAFDDRIVWLLPQGAVPYKPCRGEGLEGVLYSETRKLYLFVRGGNPALSQSKRETLFVQLLEAIDPRDAKLLEFVKDKKLPYPSITVDVFRAAFPDVPLLHASRTTKPPAVMVVPGGEGGEGTGGEPAVKPKPKRDRSKNRIRRVYDMTVRRAQQEARRQEKLQSEQQQQEQPKTEDVKDQESV